MVSMLKCKRSVVSIIGLVLFASNALADENMSFEERTVTTLDKMETSVSQTVTENFIWQPKYGYNSELNTTQRSLELWNITGDTLIKKVKLDISMNYAASIPGTDSIVAIGRKNVNGYIKEHIALVEYKNKRLTMKKWPIDYVPSGIAYKDGKVYFSEKGDRSIYEFNLSTRRVKNLGFKISGPIKIYPVKSKLWIVEGRAVDASTNLVSYDLNTKKIQRFIFREEPLFGMRTLGFLKGTDTVLLGQIIKPNVVAFNLKTGKIEKVLEDAGTFADMTSIGRCVAGINPDTQTIEFFGGKDVKKLGVVSMSDYHRQRLMRPRSIVSDGTSKDLFVRSAYPCGSCDVSQSSVVRFRDTSEFIQENCM